MTIIDAHMHLPANDISPLMLRKRDVLLQELDRNRVDRCILIADSWDETQIGTTAELLTMFPRKPDSRVLIVGAITVHMDYMRKLGELKDFLERGQIVGIKLYTGHEPFYLTDPLLEPVYDLAIRYQVPVLFHSGWDEPHYANPEIAAVILQRYPALKLVCCHCWYPHPEKSPEMTKYPNLYFDLSSVADSGDVPDAAESAVRRLIEAAPDRVMFGSDAFGCSQKAHIQFIRDLRLPPETESKIFSENAARLYRL